MGPRKRNLVRKKPAVAKQPRREVLPGNKFWRPTTHAYLVSLPISSSSSESEGDEADTEAEPFFSAPKEQREDQKVRDHALTVLRYLLIEQQAQCG